MRENGGLVRWLLPVILIAVIAVLALPGLGSGALEAPALGAPQWAGIALMAVGLAMNLFARKIAQRFGEDQRERAYLAVRMIGVAVCAIGAILVIGMSIH